MPQLEIPIKKLQECKLFVATPMYGGACMGPYMKSCLDLNTLCLKYGVTVQFFFLFNESLITRARNYLVDEFLRSECTHLMFIDSDITFNAMDVLALLAADKPVVGGPYPKKTIAWEKVFDAAKLGLANDNPSKLEQFSGDYVFNVAPGTTEIRMDEPVEVLEIGTGFMLVKRDVFTKFAKAFPQYSYKPDHNRTKHFDGSREIHMYFQADIDPVGKSKRYLSEDYWFCQLLRKIGIPIFICPWMHLSHSGMYVYGGSLLALASLSHAQQAANFSTPVTKGLDDVRPATVVEPQPAAAAAPVVDEDESDETEA